MAKKASKKSSKKVSKVVKIEKRSPGFYKKLGNDMYQSSGLLIRVRLIEGKSTVDQILAEVHKRFKDSSAKKSDVYWNRGRLKKEGIVLGKMPQAAKPAKAKKAAKAKK